MRFILGESMCDPSHYLSIAKAAEQAGFHVFTLGDSIFYPKVAVGKYPYTEDGDRSFLDGAPMMDPFQMIAAMAAVTERLDFMTGVLKLPIRHPLLVAKQVSSLAVITGERFIFGIGLSPWLEDFQGCGEDWKTRGPRMAEMMGIIRGFMSGEYYEYKSEYYDIPRSKLCPVPSTCPPMIYGGHSKAAFRRAAQLADGFTFMGRTKADLARDIGAIHEMRREYGRENERFDIYAGVADLKGPEDFNQLEDMGVTCLRMGYRSLYLSDRLTLEQKLDAVKRLGDTVVSTA